MIDIDDMYCGLVALVGLPNAGKSTLLNALIGEKLGIVSPKPNTTRITVRGVKTEEPYQYIYMDTPGLNESTKAFDRRLVQQATGALAEADVVVVLRDACAPKTETPKVESLVKQAVAQGRPTILVLTKIDRLKDKSKLLPILTEVSGWGATAVVPLTALNGATAKSGVALLEAEIKKHIPQGPWLFPAEQTTDMPINLRLAELTREQAMRLLHQELPYQVGVMTELVEDIEEGLIGVKQQLLVAKDAHKAMVLGQGGQMLKTIGMRARVEMQKMMGCGIRLDIHVKVAPRFLEREDWLREMGI
jgi:GTP-binding protein Era